jgi:iron only hydrogenase large subunit-like protein
MLLKVDSKYNKGLIYTDKNCIGCNKCIKGCPSIEANVAVEVNGDNKIYIDGDKCIGCGKCVDTCTHDARHFRDDTDQFFEHLKLGNKISVVIAPAFLINYPKEYKQILGYLKSLGVNKFISVSFGADITTWAYLNYISKYNFKGAISQPCPVIVNYIEKIEPELLEKLIPVQSPLGCTAIYTKKYMGINDKLAFISPCIAKKDEIDSPRIKGMINYNITFKNLIEHIKSVVYEKTSINIECEIKIIEF